METTGAFAVLLSSIAVEADAVPVSFAESTSGLN